MMSPRRDTRVLSWPRPRRSGGQRSEVRGQRRRQACSGGLTTGGPGSSPRGPGSSPRGPGSSPRGPGGVYLWMMKLWWRYSRPRSSWRTMHFTWREGHVFMRPDDVF
ncbi:hypothetical protein EYF80_058186 [Liparis tanakae]|uniref:Uncharacterized protein n=1 Tax=Liparis tanakae TaxID=230148 RepID=A0A4Z2ERW2_9TELE|nr:hypothetical protein EYF80_058186 [Liparis tanakae]